MATIPLLKHHAREHNQTAVSLWFLGHSSLYRVSIMGALYCYYHLFSQNFTSRHNTSSPSRPCSHLPKGRLMLLNLQRPLWGMYSLNMESQTTLPLIRELNSSSQFFKALASTLNMRLHFTSGYHPEADGQTEQTNQTLEQYLRIYCNYQQSNWVQLLPLAEFTFNNTPSSTTSISPFFTNKGYHPRLDIHSDQALPSNTA